ncbi:MAG TPA: YqgE/AlgH family protein [Flavobacteriia bacterium]|nr:YqgE/AlgH family protein [Flavobacteriia bacterium]
MKLHNGKLLISSPELLLDHVFNQSVLLLTEHNDKGSMGFMLNKPLIIRLNDIFEDIPGNIQLWNGGPVETGNMFYIHNVPELIPNAIPIDPSNNLYIGGEFEVIKKLLQQEILDEGNIKFFLGYSGWAPDQLSEEIKEKAWFVTPNNLNIFDINPKNLWKEKIVDVNPKNVIWKNAPLNPHLN